MTRWMMKSEPSVFSIDDLQRVGIEPWNGVRNYQARNYMRDTMRKDDPVLFYHSSCKEPGIVGVARVASAAYPDPSQFQRDQPGYDPKATLDSPRWYVVDIAFVRTLRRCISLTRVKHVAHTLGSDFPLTRPGNRLSVFPVSTQQWDILLQMEEYVS